MLDIILLLFNNYFKSILENFETVEQFVYFSRQYQKIRNSLSHPASSKVFIKQAKEVITYVNKIMNFLENEYFWYLSREDISNEIDKLINNIQDIPIQVHNLDSIPFQHKKIIMRESELKYLT